MRVMTPAEAAIELRVGKRTVNRLISSGALRAHNIGSTARPRLRVTDEAIEAYVASRLLPAAPVRRTA